MEILEMTLNDVNERLAALETEVREAQDIEVVEKATEEKAKLLERKAELENLEQRKADALALENGAKAKVVEKQEERKTMDIMELRNSQKYVDAYAEYIKTGEDAELRSLLTENAVDGTIAAPSLVYDEIKTAWDNDSIMSLVNKTDVKGTLKVQFEISGDDAVVHTEGSGAVDEEVLTEGIATLTPAYIKKWISVSDEVMSLRGAAFLQYIYREITHKIVKKMADVLVNDIKTLPTVATATRPSAAAITTAPAMGTVASAIANLSDEAANPVIIMNKLTWSNFKGVQYANGYGADPFEGLKVLFNNSLPAYDSASANDVYMIVGDLGYGALANFPNGEGVEFTFDPYSKKKEDLVEVLGKEFVGIGVVAARSFTNVKKPATV